MPSAPKVLFSGHCAKATSRSWSRKPGDDRAVVIGVGGGAALDTAKAVARRLAVVAIPTIAATCAAWTRCRCGYNDAGQALHFEIFDDANFWCWWNRKSSSTRRRNICWRESAIRWRNGMKQWCWHRAGNAAADRASGD